MNGGIVKQQLQFINRHSDYSLRLQSTLFDFRSRHEKIRWDKNYLSRLSCLWKNFKFVKQKVNESTFIIENISLKKKIWNYDIFLYNKRNTLNWSRTTETWRIEKTNIFVLRKDEKNMSGGLDLATKKTEKNHLLSKVIAKNTILVWKTW